VESIVNNTQNEHSSTWTGAFHQSNNRNPHQHC